ncbi:SRPBCC domain-containing protein [Arthrobacter sp. ISL-28]|uniref:SRPBCC family protein n=1 Tax=Arthrobacter sp. ISL-28 TaxID=2819108 RepID=UPI001BE8C66E|nr:SRPBCC domain-containing protein [Arthrobacter sp. ISL-28]MBT2523136.1 SRPBCC domain-containing protein [Arthrobacter sp. ISL-28]
MNERGKDAVVSVVVGAGPGRVWKALTDPSDVREYFLGTNVTSTWQEGDPVTFAGEWKGKAYEDKGTVLESRPNELLRISHFSPLSGLPDIPENYHTVEYRLAPKDDGTEVTITQGNNRSDSEAEESAKLWEMILGNLKDYLAR